MTEGFLPNFHPLLIMCKRQAEIDQLADGGAVLLIESYIKDRKGISIKIDLIWNEDKTEIEFRDEEEEERFLRATNWAKIWFLNR